MCAGVELYQGIVFNEILELIGLDENFGSLADGIALAFIAAYVTRYKVMVIGAELIFIELVEQADGRGRHDQAGVAGIFNKLIVLSAVLGDANKEPEAFLHFIDIGEIGLLQEHADDLTMDGAQVNI